MQLPKGCLTDGCNKAFVYTSSKHLSSQYININRKCNVNSDILTALPCKTVFSFLPKYYSNNIIKYWLYILITFKIQISKMQEIPLKCWANSSAAERKGSSGERPTSSAHNKPCGNPQKLSRTGLVAITKQIRPNSDWKCTSVPAHKLLSLIF